MVCKREKIPKKHHIKIFSALTIVAVVFLIIVMITVVCERVRNEVPMIFGRSIVQIVTQSMEPQIPTGTYIMIESIDADELETGDIITFYSKDPEIAGKLNTHRISEVKNKNGKKSFVTKGDANSVDDAYTVEPEAVVGRYKKKLAIVTAVGNFIKKPIFFILLVFIPAIMLFSVEVLGFIKKASEIKSEIKVQEELDRLIESGEIVRLAQEYKNNTDKEN